MIPSPPACRAGALPNELVPQDKWCQEVGSNHRPTAYEAVALPTKLSGHIGAQGGSRTLKTLILSQVPMPVRLLGRKCALRTKFSNQRVNIVVAFAPHL